MTKQIVNYTYRLKGQLKKGRFEVEGIPTIHMVRQNICDNEGIVIVPDATRANEQAPNEKQLQIAALDKAQITDIDFS